MPNLSYEACIHLLDRFIGRGIRPSLEKFRCALKELDLERPPYSTVLIAGTNGKGSTSAMVAHTLQSAGFKTGFILSPHLEDVRERIQINGGWIGKAAFCEAFETLLPIFEKFELTYYESLVLMGIFHFASEKVDIAVFEVGMGGRWDATNAIDPMITAITSVGLDHQEFLGTTPTKIAGEKAAIARSGVPLICGVPSGEAREAITAHCKEIGAALVDPVPLPVPPRHLPGAHQFENAAVAHRILLELSTHYPALTADRIQSGIRDTRFPGRLQKILETPAVFLDGAHNPDGMETVRRFAKDQYPNTPVHLIFSIMKDKDYPSICKTFPEWVEHVYFVKLDEARALGYADFKTAITVSHSILLLSQIEPAFFQSPSSFLPPLRGEGRVFFICGSLYLVGAVLKQWRNFD